MSGPLEFLGSGAMTFSYRDLHVTSGAFGHSIVIDPVAIGSRVTNRVVWEEPSVVALRDAPIPYDYYDSGGYATCTAAPRVPAGAPYDDLLTAMLDDLGSTLLGEFNVVLPFYVPFYLASSPASDLAIATRLACMAVDGRVYSFDGAMGVMHSF